MLIVASLLRFKGQEVEPGLPVPDGHGMAPHILQAHLARRTIVEGDQSKANELRARYLAGKREAEKKAFAKTVAGLESEIVQAKRDIEALGHTLAKAEQAHAELVKRRQAEEVQAKARLAELSRKLAELTKVEPPKAPEASPESDEPTKETTEMLPEMSKKALKKLSDEELLAFAERLGIAGAGADRADLIDAILAAQAPKD